MATNQDLEFQSSLILEFQSLGVDNAVAAYSKVMSSQKKLGISAEDLIRKHGSVEKAVAATAASYVKFGQKGEAAFNKLSKAAKTAVSGVNELGAGLKKLVLPASFGAAVGIVDSYNKSMLSLSASTSRLGIGIINLESKLNSIGNTLALTRVETNKLFDEFQSGMRSVSLADFENSLKRIQSIVGTNADAMGRMQSVLVEMSQQFPTLSRDLNRLTSQRNEMTQAEKMELQTRVRNLYFIGKISDAQYKQISSYLNGARQISSIDQVRHKEMVAQTEAVNAFKRQWENVSMAVGTALMPLLEKLSGFMRSLVDSSGLFGLNMKTVGGIIAGVMATRGIASLLGGGLVRLGGGLLRSRAGVGGASGGGGGLLSALGARGTPVFVTNFPTLLGGGAGGAGGGGGGGGKSGGVGAFGRSARYAMGSLALAGVSYAAYEGSEALKSSGSQILGGGVGLLGNASGVGSAALLGAQIGTVVPVIGTAVGAIAGATVGLISQWSSITDNFSDLLGTVSSDLVAAGRDFLEGAKQAEDTWRTSFEETTKQRAEEATEMAATRAREAVEQIRQDPTRATGILQGMDLEVAGATQVISQANTDFAWMDQAREDLAVWRKDYEEYVQWINEHGTNAQSASWMEEAEAQIGSLTTRLQNGTEEYENMTRAAQLTLATNEQITQEMQFQGERVRAMNDLYSSQSGLLLSIVQSMAKTGNINNGELEAGVNQAVAVLNRKRQEIEIELSMLNARVGTQTGEDRIYTETEINKLEKERVEINLQEMEIRDQISRAYDEQIRNAELLSTQAGIMVQLADNYAIGVGASAQMRIDEYNAQEKVIGKLREMRVLQEQQYAQAMMNSDLGEALALKNQIFETDNKIWQVQQAQAQGVKALRDGWISAMSAMNTGMGGFSEIVMTNQSGLAQMQRLEGSVRSNLTGAIGAGVGFDRSERFSAIQENDGMATIVGGGRIGGRGRFQNAWGGNVHGDFDMRSLEQGERGELMSSISNRASQIAGGSPSALGAENNMSLGAWSASSYGGAYTPVSPSIPTPVGTVPSSVSVGAVNYSPTIRVNGLENLAQVMHSAVENNIAQINGMFEEVTGANIGRTS